MTTTRSMLVAFLALGLGTAAARRPTADVRPASTQEFGAFLARERAQWTEVVRRAGLKPE